MEADREHVNPNGPRGIRDEGSRYAAAWMMAYHRSEGVPARSVRNAGTGGPPMIAHERGRLEDAAHTRGAERVCA
jgi:hypothetical protein